MDQPTMPTTPPRTADRGSIWLGLLVLYVVWGSTYLGIAVAVQTIAPFLMAAARFLLAGGVLLAWSIISGRLRADAPFIPPTRRQWRDSAIVGALLLGGGMGMVAFGEQTIPSGITALLIAMMPVWVAIFGGVLLGERLPRIAVIGIVVGFVGVAILAGPTAFGETGALDPLGLAAVIVSPIAWSLGSLFASHRATLPSQPLVATGAQMLTGGLVLTAMSAAAGEFGRFDPASVSTASIAAFFYLAIIGSLLAFTAYGWLLRVAPLPLIATYAYVNPVVAVILGAWFLQEPIEPRTLIAGAVIVGAVALIITARGRMQGPGRPVRPVVAPTRASTDATALGSASASTVDGSR
ncbi:MAG TPA: EamA family transporter [Candidatus Saccharimonadales bacterium]|nr:EamA family transporter [Candidatus Saccharimonadales bacterium]